MGGPVRCIGHKDTKVTIAIFDLDGIVVNSVGEVKQRRFCTESEQSTFNTVELKSRSGTPIIEGKKVLLEQMTI